LWKMRFFGNPSSPHLRYWTELAARAGLDCEVFHVETADRLMLVDCPSHNLLGRAAPVFTRLGPLRYFVGGLLARVRFRNTEFFHAHCASGYGALAMVSGRRYIITTYGSEIYEAPSRGAMYQRLIRRILDHATLVTATSAPMVDALRELFHVPASKIKFFRVGISQRAFYPDPDVRVTARRKRGVGESELVWLVNRRVLPLYNTIAVIRGFIKFLESGSSGQLFILSGDADAAYLAEARRVVDRAGRQREITFTSGFLSQEEVATLLNMADFAISVPSTDQLSAAIFEAMACRCPVLLSDIPAYDELKRNALAYVCQHMSVDGFAVMFDETARMSADEKAAMCDRAYGHVMAKYSEAPGVEQLLRLYTDVGLLTSPLAGTSA